MRAGFAPSLPEALEYRGKVHEGPVTPDLAPPAHPAAATGRGMIRALAPGALRAPCRGPSWLCVSARGKPRDR